MSTVIVAADSTARNREIATVARDRYPGAFLVVLDGMEATDADLEAVSAVADVVLDAVDVGADFDTSRTENCWTVPDEYGTTVRDLEYHRLAPGEEHTERYDVYTVEGASECRPEGTYALSRQLPVRGVADVTAYLRFAIDEDGTVSVGNDGTKISLE
jgi:hypothetical protein